MEYLQEVTSEIVQEWLNGTLTIQKSFEVRRNIELLIEEAEQTENRCNYFKIAEAGDIWRDLIGNGFVSDITPYAQGTVLYLTLQLLEGQLIPLNLAHKIILHVWN